MNARLPTPNLTWDWHFAAFGVRPRLTISWAFLCGLVAAGAVRIGQNVSLVFLVAAWLVADPLFGAVATHLLALRELRNQGRVKPSGVDFYGNSELPLDQDASKAFKAKGLLEDFFHDLRRFPGLTGHSLSALATVIACLVMAMFIGKWATTVVGAGLLGIAWIAILTGDHSVTFAESAGGLQTAVAFLLAVAVMGALTGKLVLLAAILGCGAAFRPAWLRTNRLELRLAMIAIWLAVFVLLLYNRQPVPAVLVGCTALADHLCLEENPELARGFLLTQIPWQLSLLLVSMAASQWV
ncbi:MAG: hypothetical protein ACYC6L_03670 [Anaerolineae bacterium]